MPSRERVTQNALAVTMTVTDLQKKIAEKLLGMKRGFNSLHLKPSKALMSSGCLSLSRRAPFQKTGFLSPQHTAELL